MELNIHLLRYLDEVRVYSKEMLERNSLKPVVCHFNLPDHSSQNTTICGSSRHRDNSESRKKVKHLISNSYKYAHIE